MQQIILVDEQDNQIGLGEKLEIHREGILHRAFSVYLINQERQILLQRRALSKYHSPGLWANTCCSHQYEGEDDIAAAVRRLREEMGIEGVDLTKVAEFVYQVPVPPDLIEHEYLHVFVGKYAGQTIDPRPEEVCEYRWFDLSEIQSMITSDDPSLAPWTRVTWEYAGALIGEHMLSI